jgi:hypothetical protein
VVEVDVPLPPDVDLATATSALEAGCAAEGLQLVRRGTLARYPGSLHWHLRQRPARGTLELTLWPDRRRLWLSVQDGRRAAWTEAAMAGLTARLARPAAWRPPV